MATTITQIQVRTAICSAIRQKQKPWNYDNYTECASAQLWLRSSKSTYAFKNPKRLAHHDCPTAAVEPPNKAVLRQEEVGQPINSTYQVSLQDNRRNLPLHPQESASLFHVLNEKPCQVATSDILFIECSLKTSICLQSRAKCPNCH